MVVALKFFKSPVGEVLLDFSRYEALMKSLGLLGQQLRNSFRRLFPFGTVEIETDWAPNLSMVMSTNNGSTEASSDSNRLLLVYLIVSHALLLASLLALLGWIVVRKL